MNNIHKRIDAKDESLAKGIEGSIQPEDRIVSGDDQAKPNEITSLISAIQKAMGHIPNHPFLRKNEFGDLTIAVPLEENDGSQEDVEPERYLEKYVETATDYLSWHFWDQGFFDVTCSFIGHSSQSLPWLADENDPRTQRLKTALRLLIDNMSMRFIWSYKTGQIEGFETLAAKACQESNSFLETYEERGAFIEDEGLPDIGIVAYRDDAQNINRLRSRNNLPLDLRFKFSESDEDGTGALPKREEYLIQEATIVVALLDDENFDPDKDNVYKAITYAMQEGKALVVFFTSWLNDDWPNPERILVSPPVEQWG